MATMLKPAGINNVWASNGVYIDPGLAKATAGWVVELPPYQTQNWIDWKQDSFIAHVNQRGLPQWDAVTEYQGNLSYTMASTGIIYKCVATCTGIDPTSSGAAGYWVQAFETFGSVAVVSAALQAHLNNYAVLAGIANTATARTNLSVWSKVESDARYAALGGLATQPFLVGTATDPNHAVPLSQLSGVLSQATESLAGVAKIATNTDAVQGTDDSKMLTPLKAFTALLSKSGNLAGLGNVVTARSNLGLGSMAIESATGFLRTTNNLSDVASPATARANLGLTSTATQPETYFARVANNLADVNASSARNNLGLTTAAITALASFVLKSDNLAGLPDLVAARANLGLADTATIGSGNIMFRANNLADVVNVQAARNNLGLGNLAVKNVSGLSGTDVVFTANVDSGGGATRMPDGTLLQWGTITAGQSVTFRIPYTLSYSVVCQHGPAALGAPGSGISTKTLTGFTLGYGTGGYMWQTIGI